jgi:hypothetical protein
MRWPAPFVVLLPLAACEADPHPYANVSDEALRAQARALALPQRYDLYVKVLHSSIPERPVLARDVAALGDPAWRHVFAHATSGGFTELSQALPALYAFGRRCTLAELEQLRGHADSVSGGGTALAMKRRIDSLCGAGLPAGD